MFSLILIYMLMCDVLVSVTKFYCNVVVKSLVYMSQNANMVKIQPRVTGH